MARWGRCDYRELKKLDERLQQLSEVDFAGMPPRRLPKSF